MSRSRRREAFLLSLSDSNAPVDPATARRIRAFERWCEAHGLTSLPASEQTVLRYLHSHYPRWSPAYCSNIVVAIADGQRRAGIEMPTTQLRSYLAKLRADLGAASTRPRMASLTPTQVIEMAAVLAQRSSRDGALAAVAVLRVRTDVGRALDFVLDQAVSTVTATEEGVYLPLPHGDILMSRDSDRRGHDLVVDALQLSQDQGVSLRTMAGRRPSLLARLDAAMARAGVQAQVADCSLGERDRMVAALSTRELTRARDHAVFLVGVATACRSQDLAHVQTQDVIQTEQGYVFTTLDKTAVRRRNQGSAAQGIKCTVLHVSPGKCPPWCPACSLEWFCLVRAVWSVPQTGHFFPQNFTTMAPLRTSTVWGQLGRAYGCIPSRDPQARIGTRSMRVTAATQAALAGVPLTEIARDLTHHATIDNTELYVREDPQLRLGPGAH